MLVENRNKTALHQNSFKSNTKFTETEAKSIPPTHKYMIPPSPVQALQ